MKANNLALFILLVAFGLIFGGIFVGLLWFIIAFIVELVKNGLWVALPIGIVFMIYGALVSLASEPSQK